MMTAVTFRPNRVDGLRIDRLQKLTDLTKTELVRRGLEAYEEKLRTMSENRPAETS